MNSLPIGVTDIAACKAEFPLGPITVEYVTVPEIGPLKEPENVTVPVGARFVALVSTTAVAVTLERYGIVAGFTETVIVGR